MNSERHIWAVVLAAGEGTRLASLTRDANGASVPKQYCSLNGGATFLQETLRRAHVVAGRERVTAIVARQHRRHWQGALWSIPQPNTVVQPENRGTANGVLLATLAIAARDPQARIVFLPSDHYVADERPLANALRAAASSPLRDGELALLGIEPHDADPELGYILPRAGAAPGELPRVARFLEKPSASVARTLIEQGALWNSFIFAADANTLLSMLRSRHPALVAELANAHARGPDAVAALYELLPTVDFSRAVLQGGEDRLRLLRVEACGWSDLGTPARVAACVQRLAPRPSARLRSLGSPVNLAAACAVQRLAG